MKKFIAIGISLLLSALVFGQEEAKVEGYVIEGNITGDYQGKVYLTHEDGIHGNQTNVDSCEVVNGKYSFKGPKVDVITMYFVKSKDGQLTPLFLENGRIQIAAKADNFLWATVRGTLNNDIRHFYNVMNRYLIDSMMISTVIDWERFGRQDMETENKEFRRRTDEGNSRKLDIQRYLVDRFKDQAFAPFIIMFEMIADVSTDELKQLRAKLDPVLVNHPYTKALDEFIETQDFKVGSTAYEFKLPGMKGENIALKNFRGKYVLLDFWASWCGPCRREIPNVVKLYKACKGKNFEIIGISLDKNESDWKKAVKEMKMTWPQACDFQAWNCVAAQKYNVHAVPRTVLIDPQGTVIALDLRGEQLTEKVKELIHKK